MSDSLPAKPQQLGLVAGLLVSALLSACGGGGSAVDGTGGTATPLSLNTVTTPAPIDSPSVAPASATVAPAAATDPTPDASEAETATVLGTNAAWPVAWRSNLTAGLDDWPRTTQTLGWGAYNRSFASEPGVQGQKLRVFVPAGSIDPASMKGRGLPQGGTGFISKVLPAGADTLRLSYRVKLPADFMAGRGGKLPGLCGGLCNGGGAIPNGSDGFSFRYMWTPNANAGIYAYLPTSVTYGTHLGYNQVPIKRGAWTKLTQEVKLNTVGAFDGHIKVWADDVLVYTATGLHMRSTSSLKLDSIYFDVFYGGSDDSWAAPKDTTIEFAEFAITTATTPAGS